MGEAGSGDIPVVAGAAAAGLASTLGASVVVGAVAGSADGMWAVSFLVAIMRKRVGKLTDRSGSRSLRLGGLCHRSGGGGRGGCSGLSSRLGLLLEDGLELGPQVVEGIECCCENMY